MGSWMILGAPALICLGMWAFRHDQNDLAPLRKKQLEAWNTTMSWNANNVPRTGWDEPDEAET